MAFRANQPPRSRRPGPLAAVALAAALAGCTSVPGGAGVPAAGPVPFHVQGEVVAISGSGAADVNPNPWDLSIIGIRNSNVPLLPYASQVVVALVDTGADPRQPDLAGHLLPMLDLLGHKDVYTGTNGAIDYAGVDGNGHGTHIAGTVAGVFGPNPCSILPVKAIGNAGVGDDGAIADGIRKAVDWRNPADPTQRVRVINLSLGGNRTSGTLKDAIQYAFDHDVLVVAAAGNHDGPVDFPASIPGVLAVSATTLQDSLADYSNRGPELALCAPGGDDTAPIWSTWPTYLTATDRDKGITSVHTSTGMIGTSMASPHVAGAAALLFAQDPTQSAAQVRNRLQTWTQDLGPVGPDPYFGVGRLAALKALTETHHDAH